MIFSVADLPYSPEFYRFEVVKSATQILMHETVLMTKIQWLNGLNVSVVNLNLEVRVERTAKVMFWRTAKLKAILGSQYYLVLQVLDAKNKLRDIVILTPFDLERGEKQGAMYPMNELHQIKF